MSRSRRLAILAAAAVLAAAGTSQAAVVASSLPYGGNPDWTIINPGAMTLAPGSATLTTSFYSGVWFGWGPAGNYGYNPPWTPGDSAQGNYVSMTTSFSSNAEDWSVYFYDRTNYAALLIAPTASTSYGDNVKSGVNLYFASGSQFVPLSDLTKPHTYEALLKNGQVSYRIDGVAYSGAAGAADPGFKLLVIGDGSGSSPSGVGAMTLHQVAFDNAPTENLLQSTAVPEPAAWTLMIVGFGGCGAMLRRRRRLAFA